MSAHTQMSCQSAVEFPNVGDHTYAIRVRTLAVLYEGRLCACIYGYIFLLVFTPLPCPGGFNEQLPYVQKTSCLGF